MLYYLVILLFFSSNLFYGAQQKFKPFLDKHVDGIITVYDKSFLPFLRIVAMQIRYNSEYEYQAFCSFNSHKARKEVVWIETSPKEASDYFSALEKEYQSKTLNIHKKRRRHHVSLPNYTSISFNLCSL